MDKAAFVGWGRLGMFGGWFDGCCWMLGYVDCERQPENGEICFSGCLYRVDAVRFLAKW